MLVRPDSISSPTAPATCDVLRSCQCLACGLFDGCKTRKSKCVDGSDETAVFVEGDGDLAIESVGSVLEGTEGTKGWRC